jgi:hypothetical protein
MTEKPQPQTEEPETKARPEGGGNTPGRQKPPSDGDAIAEVGDVLGGPA